MVSAIFLLMHSQSLTMEASGNTHTGRVEVDLVEQRSKELNGYNNCTFAGISLTVKDIGIL